MKLGLGLYRHMVTAANFRFARQAGATHIVADLTDDLSDSPQPLATDPSTYTYGRGVSTTGDHLWALEDLRDLRAAVNAEGLELAALENFDPSHWYDVLLDGPRKREQLENLKTLIRRVGQAGIPCIGYNFSIAGAWGQVIGNFARGGAQSVGFLGSHGPAESPIPNGHVWNMVYDPPAPQRTIGRVTPEQIWQRVADLLETVIPVAEEAGVRLAAHPDDPPMAALRATARLVYQPRLYQQLLDLVPSHYNALEFCQGTTAEMAEGDVYEAIYRYSSQGKIAYVHFRKVRGKMPEYREVFLDEGDVDMFRALRIYARNGFDGVFIPDHTPLMACGAPWHVGMAYALGYMRAAMTAVEAEGERVHASAGTGRSA